MIKKQKNHRFHLRRIGLLATLIVAFFIVRLDSGTMPRAFGKAGNVLAYASEMSQNALLTGTNAARGANGLSGFSLNSQLNNSAQAKAQHMATNNYWAHVAPDGTEPWYFFSQAGYAYVRAGENLAYGFVSSQGTVDGWMNSASHRANILGDYTEVGFGIVNTPNYQSSGEQTIVVAHYGSRAAPPPAPAPAPAVNPVAPASPTPPQSQTPAPAPEPVSEAPAAETPAQPVEPSAPSEGTNNPSLTTDPQPSGQPPIAPVQTASQSRVSVLSMITSRNLSAAALMSLAMVAFAITGYALTHRSAFQHAVAHGEQFVVRHPGIDTGITAAVTSLILMTTYGNLS